MGQPESTSLSLGRRLLQALRTRGKTHACALRCLGQRWLKILWKMWHTRRPYDAELHARNQLKHGSWVLQLQRA